jgi:hypothetical protein
MTASNTTRNARRAFTVVEMMVYLCIFSLLMAGVASMFKYLGHFQSATKRLDVLHDLRLSSFRLAEELALSQEFLFPTGDNPLETVHQILYFDNRYELIGVFIQKEKPSDPFGDLVKLNWTEYLKAGRKGDPRLEKLVSGAIELNVSRPTPDYIEYELKIEEFKPGGQPSGKVFSLVNSARLRGKL